MFLAHTVDMNTVFATFTKEFDALELLAVADYTPVEVGFDRGFKHSTCPRERVLLILNTSLFQGDTLLVEVLTLNLQVLN